MLLYSPETVNPLRTRSTHSMFQHHSPETYLRRARAVGRLRGHRHLISGLLLAVLLLACSPPPAPAPTPMSLQDSRDLTEQRLEMVRTTIAEPNDGRPPITDARVLEAMRSVPRHLFVPRELRSHAYEDRPLAIGHGQTISQPYIVALMTELLDPSAEDTVLEVGTGSGYQAAILAVLVDAVYSIEIVEPLGVRARGAIAEAGADNVHLRVGDGYAGWPEAAPFDAIIVTAAPDHVPQPLVDQLAVGGRMVIPVGDAWATQELMLLEKTAEGELRRKRVMPVRFVPLTGDRADG